MSQTDQGFRFEFGKFRNEIMKELQSQLKTETDERKGQDLPE